MRALASSYSHTKQRLINRKGGNYKGGFSYIYNATLGGERLGFAFEWLEYQAKRLNAEGNVKFVALYKAIHTTSFYYPTTQAGMIPHFLNL